MIKVIGTEELNEGVIGQRFIKSEDVQLELRRFLNIIFAIRDCEKIVEVVFPSNNNEWIRIKIENQ